MNRREFLNRSTIATVGIGLSDRLFAEAPGNNIQTAEMEEASSGSSEITEAFLKGVAPLSQEGDFAALMVEGIHRFLLNETQELAGKRAQLWNQDYTSPRHYAESVEPNRRSFRRKIGVVDSRVSAAPPEFVATIATPALIANEENYKIYAIRWPVFAPSTADFGGMYAEGLLLQPDRPPVARVVTIPDADWTPEMLVGLTQGVSPSAQFARRMAENGCETVVPLIINRADTFSGIAGVGMTNMTHREWVYRMAFEMGRHIIGYEVQKVLAIVDWFEAENIKRSLPIGVAGYGEGGLLAFYSAAADTRIDATLVSGYFQERENLWKEPIYRDVWGLLREFGDAEIAALIAPRGLVIEATKGPEVLGPPPVIAGRLECACPNGSLGTPELGSVQSEFDRARATYARLDGGEKIRLVVSEGGSGLPGSEDAIQALLLLLGVSNRLSSPGRTPTELRKAFDPSTRLHRQLNQMGDFTQALARKSPEMRQAFWSKADASSLSKWQGTTKFYREYIWEEVIGRLPLPSLPPNPRARLILDQPKFVGYEIMLDVWPGVFAYGILLLPKGMRKGERRPAVVCQHGLEGRPIEIVDPKIDSHFYHHFGVNLADEGFIVYAPQNPYTGDDKFRIIQRMGHPVKLALFSFILGQHEQTLNWLTTLPCIDPNRIGFYGLSYGGKTAIRVPPLLERYALSICSGDFNEWVWKTTNVLDQHSYMLRPEYDMYEFDFANIVNYDKLAELMAPRPFMVERGHDDVVGTDQWVAFEYAGVREFYDKVGIGDSTRIEFFNGPHTIHGVGTFEFLRQKLGWKQ